jgi:hypothetical protein
MKGAELLEYVRRDLLRDSARPYLWGDDLIMMYLNEAEQTMAEETYCLSDNTSADATVLTIGPGQAEYDLHESVLHVYSATIEGDSIPLVNLTHRRAPTNISTSTGRPTCYNLDESQNTITFHPIPDEELTILLRVARLPLEDFTASTEPEISKRLHLDLCEFAAYRCMSLPDTDGFNPKVAKEFQASWLRRVVKAKRKYYRLRHGTVAHAAVNWTGKRR